MADRQHRYAVRISWTGNKGSGTGSYRGYERAHEISVDGKPTIAASSDPAFRGDSTRWNPEELFVASISACHKLWYLALCAQAGVVVTAYEDAAEGHMTEHEDGSGQFAAVILHPHVTISPTSDDGKAMELHQQAHAMCFIARSVNFPVSHVPTISREAERAG